MSFNKSATWNWIEIANRYSELLCDNQGATSVNWKSRQKELPMLIAHIKELESQMN